MSVKILVLSCISWYQTSVLNQMRSNCDGRVIYYFTNNNSVIQRSMSDLLNS